MQRLYQVYPEPSIELNFKSPFELLVATILAAQATDKVVNTLTPILFQKYPSIQSMAEAPVDEIDTLVNKVLFHKNKSQSIKASAQAIMYKHHGQVPDTLEELDALPGVARKTANVVLNNAYHKPYGIVIDTHGIRLSNKFGLTSSKDPVQIEKDLMKLLPRDKWIDFGNLITLHGRYFCIARPHSCTNCPLGDLCPEYPWIH